MHVIENVGRFMRCSETKKCPLVNTLYYNKILKIFKWCIVIEDTSENALIITVAYQEVC